MINQGYITFALLGDVNPFEYGGTFLQFNPEQGFLLTAWEPETQRLYRTALESYTYTNTILSDNPYHAGKEEGAVWFNNKLTEIASVFGTTRDDLVTDFLSDNLIKRSQAVIMVAEYYGWEEFDQYPLKPANANELRNLKSTFERWKKQASQFGR